MYGFRVLVGFKAKSLIGTTWASLSRWKHRSKAYLRAVVQAAYSACFVQFSYVADGIETGC